jgi:hypothetical protein
MQRIISVSIGEYPLEEEKKYVLVLPSAIIEGNDGK